MKTIAQTICETLNSGHWSAFTLQYGYACAYSGKRTLFDTGRVTKETRNKTGRVTRMVLQYQDNSKIEYRYSENSGYKLKVAQ